MLIGSSTASILAKKMFEVSAFHSEVDYLEDIDTRSVSFSRRYGLFLLDYDFFSSRILEVSNLIFNFSPISQIYILTTKNIDALNIIEFKNYGAINGAVYLPISQESLELRVIEILGRYKILTLISEEVEQKNLLLTEELHLQDALLGLIITIDSLVKFSYIKESVTEKSATLLGLYFSGLAAKLSEGFFATNEILKVNIGSMDLIIHSRDEVMFIFLVRSLNIKETKIIQGITSNIIKDISNNIPKEFLLNNIITEEDQITMEAIVKKHDLHRLKRSIEGTNVSCVLYQPSRRMHSILESSDSVRDIITANSLDQILSLAELSFPKVICYSCDILELQEVIDNISKINRMNPIVKQIICIDEYTSEILLYLMNNRSIDYIILMAQSSSTILNTIETAISKSITMALGAYSSMSVADIEDHLFHSLLISPPEQKQEQVTPELISLKVYEQSSELLGREWDKVPEIDFKRLKLLLSSLRDMDDEILHQSDNMVGFKVSDHYFLYSEIFGIEFLYTLKNIDESNLDYINNNISESAFLLTDHIITKRTYNEPILDSYTEAILEETNVRINSVSSPTYQTDKNRPI